MNGNQAPLAFARAAPELFGLVLFAPRLYARTSLVAYKVPRHAIFVNDLPKSPIGKVLHRQLRDRLANRF